jgi:hypothetical protein
MGRAIGARYQKSSNAYSTPRFQTAKLQRVFTPGTGGGETPMSIAGKSNTMYVRLAAMTKNRPKFFRTAVLTGKSGGLHAG